MYIKIDNISHSYFKKTLNEVEALKHVSLDIEKGSFVALVGETGSGKSTLVQHLNGLLLPDSGTITIDGYTIVNKRRKNKKIHLLRKKVGLIFQFPEYQLFEETVLKDVSFGPKNFGYKGEEALNMAKLALKQVNLDESYYERSPFELSGGERRKVSIAGILAINPDILVLDEPTAGLDYQASEDVMNLVKKLNEEGKTIILVTHDMNLVYKYAQRVCLLRNGEVAFDGTPIELFSSNESEELELPHLYRVIKELNERGCHIPLEKMHSVKDVVSYLKEQQR